MSTNHPTASLTGRQEWEWTRIQSSQTAEQSSKRASARESNEQRPSVERNRSEREQCTTLHREIQELEAALERKEQQLQCVIEQYERLLAEKNRKLATQRSATDRQERTVSDLLTDYF